MPTNEEEKAILDAAMFLAHISQGSMFPYKNKEKCHETAGKLLEYIKKVDKMKAENNKRACKWGKEHPERHREINRKSMKKNYEKNKEKIRAYQHEYYLKRKEQKNAKERRNVIQL